MRLKKILRNSATVATSLVRYNLKIIFAGKFIYFLIAAIVIFLLVTISSLFSDEALPSQAKVYGYLLVPGLLLIFYPITFGIQNDVDSRMIEILFGIPNYRYKVWLLRLVLIFALALAILLVLTLLSSIALIAVPVFEMLFHLMFPIVFLGCMAFMVSTIIRNGSGTAVVMVIIGLFFLLGSGMFENIPKWNVFLNPFELPEDMNEVVWATVVFDNRLYLLTGIIISLLFGLLNLQKREKFL
jgi:hypothetical protein